MSYYTMTIENTHKGRLGGPFFWVVSRRSSLSPFDIWVEVERVYAPANGELYTSLEEAKSKVPKTGTFIEWTEVPWYASW